MSTDRASKDAFDRAARAFQAYQRANPGASFGQYSTEVQLAAIKRGVTHPTLGTNLNSGLDWRTVGKTTFESLVRRHNIQPDHSLADYGCGSLRLGVHFIEYLQPEHYLGIDVILDFVNLAVADMGDDLVQQKKPIFRDFNTLTLGDAERFDADIVLSTACLFQIHPDEQQEMFGNLKMLARKRNSRLIFDTKLTDELVRYRNSAWAWPIDHYTTNLPEFDLVETRVQERREEAGHSVEWTWLVFERKTLADGRSY